MNAGGNPTPTPTAARARVRNDQPEEPEPYQMINPVVRLVAGAALLLALAGCGYTPGQRALTGGAIGAGSGAILGGALFGNPAMGALVGGGAGALGGAVTAPQPHYHYGY